MLGLGDCVGASESGLDLASWFSEGVILNFGGHVVDRVIRMVVVGKLISKGMMLGLTLGERVVG